MVLCTLEYAYGDDDHTSHINITEQQQQPTEPLVKSRPIEPLAKPVVSCESIALHMLICERCRRRQRQARIKDQMILLLVFVAFLLLIRRMQI